MLKTPKELEALEKDNKYKKEIYEKLDKLDYSSINMAGGYKAIDFRPTGIQKAIIKQYFKEKGWKARLHIEPLDAFYENVQYFIELTPLIRR
jgi:hypothetical protein